MATDGKTLSDQELKFVRESLDAAELADRLLRNDTNASVIGFAEIHAYATRPDHMPSDALLRALEGDTQTRRDFEALLRNVSAYWMPQVAAASSGEITTREVDGCRMTFRASKADSDQVFVIIEFTDKAAKPETLFVCGREKPMTKIALPSARDGRVQLLLESNSAELHGLRDVDTEVFLR